MTAFRIKQVEQKILASCYYRDRGRLSTGIFDKMKKDNGIPDWQMKNAIRNLCRDNKLVRVGQGAYERPAEASGWLTMPWRQHSNEQLGVEFHGRCF